MEESGEEWKRVEESGGDWIRMTESVGGVEKSGGE